MALKILFCTDIHLRAVKPLSRLDTDFLGSIIGKIEQVREISSGYDIVLLGGDIFDRPDASHGVVTRAINAFSKFKVPVYTVIGNHDIYGYNGQTIDKTAMGILLESGAVKKLDSLSIGGVQILGLHAYDKETWEIPREGNRVILVVHKMITDRPFPGGSCILVSDVAAKTNADIILSGDIHYPHNVKIGEKLFINPGSLSRLSIADRNRHPQISELIFKDDGTFSHRFIKLECPPSEEIFDLEGYKDRVEEEEYSRDSISRYAEAVMSVKGSSHKMSEFIDKWCLDNNVKADLKEMVGFYHELAEKELLAEQKDA